MKVNWKLKVDRAKLDYYLSGQWHDKAEQVVTSSALAIEAGAKVGAPVLTGALRNSIHVEGKGWNWREIKDGVIYGVFQELGTSRGVSAKFFLTNAAEKQANKFFADVEAIFK